MLQFILLILICYGSIKDDVRNAKDKIIKNVTDNDKENISDFIHDIPQFQDKVKYVFWDIWGSIVDLGKDFGSLFEDEKKFSRTIERMSKKYENDRERCESLGGKNYPSTIAVRCQFPYSKEGCLGLCAHGVDLYGGYKEEFIKEIKTAVDVLETENKTQLDENYGWSKEIIDQYDVMHFDADDGCVCYLNNMFPRKIDSKNNYGLKIFDKNLENDDYMVAVMKSMESTTKHPNNRNKRRQKT